VLVLVLPLVWLLKMDATMVAMVQRRFVDLVVHAMMHTLVLVFPLVWLLKMDPTMVVVVEWRYADLVMHTLVHAVVVGLRMM